ncbi:PAS domain-containing protein [Endothiovibrio diazotrophicus]
MKILKRLAAIAEEAEDAVFAIDHEGRYLLANRAGERITGRPHREILGLTNRDLFPTEQAAALDADDRRVMEGGRIVTFEERVDTPDGQRVFLTTKGPLVDTNGRPVGVFGIVRDITESKQTERALRESENRYRALVEQSLAGIYIIQDGYLRYVNRGFATTFGYNAPEELIDRVTILELIAPEERERVAENIRRRVEGEIEDIHYTVNAVRRDGRPITVEVHGRAFDYRGAPAVIGLLLDVSSRKAAEDALRQSELRLHDIVNVSADWIWEVDTRGVYTYASESVRDLLGYSAEEIVGQTPFDLMPAEEAERIRNEFLAIIERREPFCDLENTNRHKDGSLRCVSTNGMPFFDEAGELIGYRGLDRDITERRQAEAALRDSEARYRTLLTHAADAVFIADPRGHYTYVNHRACELLGYRTDELLALTIADLAPPQELESTRERFTELAERGQLRTELNLRCKDGREVPVELNAARLPDGNYFGACRDITERKHAEQMLRRQADELRTRNEELERFNRVTVGRELRMVELKQEVNALARELGRPPPYALEFLDPAPAERGRAIDEETP